ncbi:pleckstrin homology domain-containing family A member 5 isoform X10 [Conger conger]|uniref:pleckstrin homology domain-containing family A member 5 isoform X10 n=1 Tax=Conger conger TaxID=82655 RepID=UPI002A59A2B1|nr:pleckstrin homology domain-containing family A member 5 isoform X10 [Conger conger]
MAADLNPEWLSCLPSSWSYGVTRDGRVFFINEEAKSTTWLHPVTGEAVITGHRKTPDLPTGWEEGYTFEGARCFINHNERKVTCKHPVSGLPSQDNCIFVVNEQTAPKTPTPVPANEKKERPVSTMSEASNYTGGSDYATHPVSPAGRASRSSKKIHNFGKRSNSIKRNPNAPVVKSNWLYKQDSTGMKLWKKRWFVLCDMCLFYYRDEKEEGILGSILLPSFHVSMLSVDDHINRKYAFKATHPNMRTYYFCTDTAKEMESWMKVMTDAALVHTDPVKRMDRLKVEHRLPQEVNNVMNHRVLTRPEAQNNERNREAAPPPLALPPEERKQKDAEKYGFQQDGVERPLTKINSVKLQPAQAAAIAAAVNSSRQQANSAGTAPPALYKPPQVNGSGDRTPGEVGNALPPRAPSQAPAPAPAPAPEPERTLQRTNSMQQLEQWVRVQRGRGQEEETRSITSYQTLPRNMPSHRAQVVPLYPEGYRTLPRNMLRPDSICSMSPSVYDRALGPQADKRRSMRDDTMWQLFEWQQRQAYTKQGPPLGYGTLPSPKTMVNLSEHVAHSIPPSPSHGSLAHYQGYSPLRSYSNMSTRSEVSSPVFRGDVSIDRRHRPHIPKYAYPPDRRSMPAGIPAPTITPQALQGKTVTPDDYRDNSYIYRPEELDIDAKLSRLCEQDKVVRTQEDKLQQLHREKHTLETALLSASQEIELSADNPAAVQCVVQQRDVLQSGLLSTCRELSRVNNELDRSWREYDRLETDVTLAKNNLLEQLEALGSPQTEPPSQQHVQIQKELWRIQDVMEALSKNKPQRSTDNMGFLGNPISNKNKSEGPDYRLYKSEPELTTVAEVDETNGEDKSEPASEKDPSGKGMSYPVGIVPPRTKSPMPESSTIASYVTLRKTKKPEPRTDRPRSAVDQLCQPDAGRPRMSVEEQLERIRRHQQASLRERKKGLNVLGAQENSPSRTPSFSKENPFRTAQGRKREEVLSSDIQELEASLREQDLVKEQETPAEEIARLKEVAQQESYSMERELSKPEKVVIPERYVELEPEEALSPEEEADKQKKVDRIKALIAKNSMQSVVPTAALSPQGDAEEESPVAPQEKIINISYELAAEASKRSKLVAVNLSTPPQSPTSPSPPPQLADGSHFMCV